MLVNCASDNGINTRPKRRTARRQIIAEVPATSPGNFEVSARFYISSFN
jgi:hypothetical protein